MYQVRRDTSPCAHHLERMPAQHGQTYDPQEEPLARIPVLKPLAATFKMASRYCA